MLGVVKDHFPHYGTKTKEMFNLAAVIKKGLILVVEESCGGKLINEIKKHDERNKYMKKRDLNDSYS